jgi:hypothetical protein
MLNLKLLLAAALSASALMTPLTAHAWVAGRTVVGPNGGVYHSAAAGRPIPPPPPPGWYGHPAATAAAVTAATITTAAVVGSIVHSIPPSCSAVVVNGLTYQNCGSTWYQPQYVGTSVQYIVVAPPR